jgi:pimeloyl-ACP methyl ester carboxylesterase
MAANMKFLQKCIFVLCVTCLTSRFVAAQNRYFDSNGMRIRYVEHGAGDPVILVHGFSATVKSNWGNTGVIAALGKNNRVVALDYRGHGQSGKPHDTKAYGNNEIAKDVLRLMDHLKIERAHVVGYSLGANIVAKLLTTNPERFITATMGGSSGMRGTPNEQTRKTLDDWAESMTTTDTPFRWVVLQVAPTDEPPLTEEMIRQQSSEFAGSNDVEALAAMLRGMDLFVTNEQLASVKVPTLAVVGSADPALLGVNSLKRLWPALSVVVIDGATHSNNRGRGVTGRPEFVQAIRDFIATHK